MWVPDDFFSWFLYAFNTLNLSPWDRGIPQRPVQGISSPEVKPAVGGPIFSPPGGPNDFFCDYSAMGSQWKACTKSNARDCWLQSSKKKLDIHTDYEDPANTPTGITRKYWLDTADFVFDGDGFKDTGAKAFNQSYPGPWIKACWGDDLEITVTNHLKYNGTTIHWHGIRQYQTLEADGVNGVTQCPIAPGTSYTYRFKAMQYGTSWYHSHYALQYADGLLGPLTIFGPSSANYDEAVAPTLMTDHIEVSAFSRFYEEISPGKAPPPMTDILLNGTGIYPCTATEAEQGVCQLQDSRYNITVQRNKKYLLRLINTSVATTFVFAIDGHNLTVVSTDFVPIHPYKTDSVLIGIGQRYNVILEADPIDDKVIPRESQSFWIRTIPATGCARFETAAGPDNRTGILYYNDTDLSIAKIPTTTQAHFPIACSDEPYESLTPIVPWTVGPPANLEQQSVLEVGIEGPPFNSSADDLPPNGTWTHWELGPQPLWINFSDPTILHVDTGKTNWTPESVVIPQSVPADTWIYLLVTATNYPFTTPTPGRNFVPVSHPIHLHGHDFVVLSQSSTPYWPGISPPPKLDNPPRRDVALLPSGGYLLLAFKADNPGSWLMHCHIAWHASSGLAVQILERDGSILIGENETSRMQEIEKVCDNWNNWVANRGNWWDPQGTFQDDSGI